jgi:hypothetical protein
MSYRINKNITINEAAQNYLFNNYGKIPLTKIAKHLNLSYNVIHKNVALFELNKKTRECWNKKFNAADFFNQNKF